METENLDFFVKKAHNLFMKNLVLIGFMGSGKSTVGQLVATEMNMNFVDVDFRIEEQEGISISEIFARYGESAFRDLESKMIQELSSSQDLVIATGGGVVLRPSNMEVLGQSGILVYLHVDEETVLTRTKGHSHRPLLKGDHPSQRIAALLKERQPLYDAIAHCVETKGRTLQEVVRAVIRIYRSKQISGAKI